MPSDTDTDVVVVGAGPTGLVLAASLAVHGVRCRLVDKAPVRSTRSRALVVHARSLELLDRLGVARELVARGERSMRVGLHVGGRPVAGFEMGDVGAGDAPFPFILFVSQAETEDVLARRVAALGVAEERGVEFLGQEATEKGGVLARLRGPDGAEAAVRARFVVGCDGAHSAVRKSAGLSFEGEPYPQDFILADAIVDFGAPIEKRGLDVHLSRSGFLAFFPMKDGPGDGGPTHGLYRVITSVRSGVPEDAPEPTLDDFREAFRAAEAPRVSIREPRWLARFRLHHRGVDRYRAGNVFVAGDAAHIHSPAGGQGMNTGMQDAENLAWKLALVLARRAPERLLDSYHDERHPVGRRLLRTTDRFFGIGTSRNPIVAGIRTILLPRVAPRLLATPARRRFAFRFVSQLGIRYRRSPIVREHAAGFAGGPRAGDRAPDGPLATADARQAVPLHSLLVPPAMHLLAFLGGEPVNERHPAGDFERRVQAALGGVPAERIRVRLVVPTRTRPWSVEREAFVDETGDVRRRYGLDGPGLYLVRPDGHVGFRSAGTDTARLVSYLRSTFEIA